MTIDEALKIKGDCDPTDCDCDTCPIGKKMGLEAHGAGVDVVFTVCGMLSAIQDCLEDEATWRYREE